MHFANWNRALRAAVAVFALGMGGVGFADPPVTVVEAHRKIREIETAIVRGKIDPLRMDLQEQARNRPGDVMLRVYLAWCGMPSDDSWNAFKGIANIYPEQPWARLGMGRIYLSWKLFDQARTELQAALRANPNFYPAMVALGDVNRVQGKLDDAVALYRKALSIEDDPAAHGGLGLTLVLQQHSAEAKAELSRAAEQWPEQPAVLAELVRVATADKDLQTAAKWSEKLAEYEPRNGAAWRMLADVRFEAGDKAGAAKSYEKASQLGVLDAKLEQRLASIYRDQKNLEGEQHAVEQLAVLEKKAPEHPVRLSEIAEEKGELEPAEAQLLEAIDRAPKRADLHARLARLRMKREEFHEALEAYRAALAAPESPVDGLEKEASTLANRFKLPKRPAKGSIDQIYGQVGTGLHAFFVERAKQKPGLGGTIKVRVHVNANGVVEGTEVIADTVGDPWLAGHAYFALKDAVFPKQKRDPVFEFELKPINKAKGK